MKQSEQTMRRTIPSTNKRLLLRPLRVLVACEFSGIVRDAFIRIGHEAISCDTHPSEQPGPHYQGDVRDILNDGWDMMIAHPPCRFLCNSGVRWLYNPDDTLNHERWEQMRPAAELFLELWHAPIDRICIENSIMHQYAAELVGGRQDQIIQPWQFGHGETKAICLWLKNLQRLRSTNIVTGRIARVHRTPPGPNQWRDRSRFLLGIADGMADQWGTKKYPMPFIL